MEEPPPSMSQPRNSDALTVMTVAGFDPSGGAGLLADIKTFESEGLLGLAVQTALTVQNDISFESCRWEPEESIIDQVEILLKRFKPAAVKIGIIEGIAQIHSLLDLLPEDIPIVWDPVLKASAGFEFHDDFSDDFLTGWESLLPRITL
ncbi:MAG: hydroxymethylpyrimidine/phosphomethylpyrimidine kinase, partial [Limisphaerales bacterium]